MRHLLGIGLDLINHRFHYHLQLRTSLVAQTVKRLSTMREAWVRALGWEDPLEKEMAIHSSLQPRKAKAERGECHTEARLFTYRARSDLAVAADMVIS